MGEFSSREEIPWVKTCFLFNRTAICFFFGIHLKIFLREYIKSYPVLVFFVDFLFDCQVVFFSFLLFKKFEKNIKNVALFFEIDYNVIFLYFFN